MKSRAIYKLMLLTVFLLPLTSAAQDISPFNGLWAIDEENNGGPGRGFQLDVQNDIIVLTFYGYQESGPATFYIASGSFNQGSNSITMPLNEFAGGTAFGQAFKNAEFVGSAGDVTIDFTDMAHGEICLPGESCKAVSALNFGLNPVDELLGEWIAVTSGFDVNVIFLNFDQRTGDEVTGTAIVSSDGFDITLDLFCELADNPTLYRYSCGVEVFGEVERIQLNVFRNGISGETEDFEDVMGWRVKTEAGRMVMPN